MSEYQYLSDTSLSDGARELISEEIDLVNGGGIDLSSAWNNAVNHVEAAAHAAAGYASAAAHTAVGYVEAAGNGGLIAMNAAAKQPVAQVPVIGQLFVGWAGVGGMAGGVYEHAKGKF